MIFANSFKEDLGLFFKNYAWILCLALVVVIILTILIIYVFKNGKKKENKIPSNKWVDALGGKDNIIKVEGIGSRLTCYLRNKEILKKELLTELGVTNTLEMSEKITFVIKEQAEQIAEEIRKSF